MSKNSEANQIHSSDDALIAGHLILDYFDNYKMDYSKYVYLEESALTHSKFKNHASNNYQLGKLAGVNSIFNTQEGALIPKMLH